MAGITYIVCIRIRRKIAAAAILILLSSGVAAQGPVRLAGRVVDENNAAIAGAQLSLRGGGEPLHAVTDATGAFAFELPAPGDYTITAERQGFFRIENRPVHITAGASDLTLVLNPAREVFEHVEVSYSPRAIDFDRTQPAERLTNTQLLQVPYSSTNTIRNAMRIIPGVVQDNIGGLHMNGGAEEQVLYTLDGFQINDPITGQFKTRLSAEAVRSMEATPVNPAEFGKGSAGALAIKTSTGDDRFRYSGTNFVPGLEYRKGMHLGGWTPRFNFSGPIRRGRAWFSESLDVQYDNTIVEDLPEGRDRTHSWRLSNLLRNQVNLTPSNILTTGFLASLWVAPRSGLDALSPTETTVDRRLRQYFFNIKDQFYFHRGALIEAGYAANRTFERQIPQGHGILVVMPEGRRGNYFQDLRRYGGRDQLLANVFLPAFAGHQLKTGVDIDAINYRQDVSRTGYEFWRADATLSRRTFYAGPTRLVRDNTEASWYVQDSWKPWTSVLLEAGLRVDWDRLVRDRTVSPRVGASWAPPRMESTKVSAGYGVVHDQSNIRMFSRPLDQYLVTTHFAPDGALAYGPALTVFTIDNHKLKTPRYTHWNLGIDHRFGSDLYAGVHYLRRRGENGFTYVNLLPEAGFDAVYRLRNDRRDVYDSVQVNVRQTFRRQYEWLASYTRSRAHSNAVVDISAEDPLIVTSNIGRMPWDTPNRFLGWGYFPTWWENWAVAALVEARNGFPFSVYDSAGRIAGELNNRRFPIFFELNLHLERRFTFRAHRWAFRFGFNNITNHDNPNVVNADITSPNFLHMYGGAGRSANVRLRWLGKN